MADIMESTFPFPVCSKRNLRFSLGLSSDAFVTFIHFFLNGSMIFFSFGIFLRIRVFSANWVLCMRLATILQKLDSRESFALLIKSSIRSGDLSFFIILAKATESRMLVCLLFVMIDHPISVYKKQRILVDLIWISSFARLHFLPIPTKKMNCKQNCI